MLAARSLGLFLMFGVTATPAFAQSNEPIRQASAVPLELATALAASGGFVGEGDPQILIGALPEWVVDRLFIPPGSRILGSAFMGSTVVAIISVPTWSDSIISDLERGFQQRGWKAPPTMPTFGGFRPSPTPSSRAPRRLTLCRESQIVSASVTRQQSTSTTVSLRLASSGSGMCNPPRMGLDSRRPQMPTLYDPPGATETRMPSFECATQSLQLTTGSGTRLKTSMSPDAVLEHYGRQLADSGWLASASNQTVSRVWMKRDSAGAPVEVMLTVKTAPTDSTCRAVSLELRSSRTP